CGGRGAVAQCPGGFRGRGALSHRQRGGHAVSRREHEAAGRKPLTRTSEANAALMSRVRDALHIARGELVEPRATPLILRPAQDERYTEAQAERCTESSSSPH